MIDGKRPLSFVETLEIVRRDVVCIVGAGGKTSLMFQLAREAKLSGLKTLVTTTTRLKIPDPAEYDAIDLSGNLFNDTAVTTPGIYIGGQLLAEQEKMMGVDIEHLAKQQENFDLILIEADGAARKPLKGWNSTEPVIPQFTTKTIGVVDIQAIGKIICNNLVHRLEIFLQISDASIGDSVSIPHLLRIISHENGLSQYSQGEKLLYFNKVESKRDCNNVIKLRNNLNTNAWKIFAGSIHKGVVLQLESVLESTRDKSSS